MLKSSFLIEDAMNNFKRNSNYARELIEHLFFTYREIREEYGMLEILLNDQFAETKKIPSEDAVCSKQFS
jgi:hypothetical protein